jgi:predicted RNase H-like nuclease (RuvC/YqgF family)
MKVYGLDVITGSVRSRSRRPMYALVVLENTAITSEIEVSQFRLLRKLARDEPEILAVDSIQELAPDQPALCTFLQQLPPRTRLVQVTGGEKKETLGKIAARYNISVNRFDPFSEARAAACIASLGGGAEVVAFENACEVVVSRHRSLGKGGWSQNRYVRKIHGAVLQKAREIESELRSTSLKFEKKESRAFGGASRVSFQVQAPRGMIPIPTHRGADVQVRVLCRRLDRIRYRPLTQRPRHLIVGIDPGTTTAYAAVDLDGNVVHIGSSRQFSMADSIEALYRIGKPLVIASDVQQMPFSVEKIRRAFQAVGFTPRVDRTVEEKQELTKGYAYANVHERDALAAALDAFRHYRHRLQGVIKRVPPGYDLDEVRAGIIRGLSLEQIMGARDTTPAPPPAEPPAPLEEGKRDERVILLEGQVKRLREFVQELQKGQKAQEKEILRLQKQVQRERSSKEQKLKRDSEIARQDQLIQNLKRQVRREQRHARSLQKRLDQMRQHAALEGKGDLLPLKVLPALTRDGIHQLSSDLGIHPGDFLYVARTDGWGRSAIREIADLGVQALVVGASALDLIDPLMQLAFAEIEMPLLLASQVRAEVRGKVGMMDRVRFEVAKKEWKESQVKRERRKKTEMLESIFREYRWEREKEVHRGG